MTTAGEVAKQPQIMTTTTDPTIENSLHNSSVGQSPAYDATDRGSRCTSASLCDRSAIQPRDADGENNSNSHLEVPQQAEPPVEHVSPNEEHTQLATAGWKGWAELENDPDIFTIILHEWGLPQLEVKEIFDIAELFDMDPSQALGLVFLSRYVPPEVSPPPDTSQPGQETDALPQPWFANQISKFSCGSVALMNIIMNGRDLCLGETLSDFKSKTSSLTAKERGMALDNNAKLRDVHNSFSTRLDRMIVDVLLKEDAQRHKKKKAQEARQAQTAVMKKRKRGGARFTRKRKKATADDGDEVLHGNHFVAYVEAHANVWKLDGIEPQPARIGCLTKDTTWLNVAAEDLWQQMQQALQSGTECSLMSVTKASMSSGQLAVQRVEKERKQEDWAPFIEHMLRLHAEKGDLQELLGL